MNAIINAPKKATSTPASKKSTTLRAGKNVAYAINDGKLIISIDLAKNFGPSASGKTNIIASTFVEGKGCFITLPDGNSFSLSVITPSAKQLAKLAGK